VRPVLTLLNAEQAAGVKPCRLPELPTKGLYLHYPTAISPLPDSCQSTLHLDAAWDRQADRRYRGTVQRSGEAAE
jgi:hypothetical protein